jgi:hypothetical protein
MRERGAPLTDAEIDVIIGYLAAYYGRDPAPAPAPDTLAATSDDPVAKLLADNGCTACHDVTKEAHRTGVSRGCAEIRERFRRCRAPRGEDPCRRRGRLGAGADASEYRPVRSRCEAPRRVGSPPEVNR